MKIESLTKLSESDILHGSFPLRELLEDSLYYPACDLDGGVVRYCNEHFDTLGICSYVYVDYAAGEGRLRAHLDEFRGYHLLAARPLSPSDVGADRPFPMPDGINPEDYIRYRDEWKPFACWAIYERDENYDSSHGPERFSLLYLGAEGAAAYAGLYVANGITPKAMAIIQPGTGFGLNWTDFCDWNAPLARTVRMGKSMPEYFFFGGHGDFDYLNFQWPGYHHIDTIYRYYSDNHGCVTAWAHKQQQPFDKEQNNNMSYITFIKSQKEAINRFEQEGFAWKNRYESSFLDMVSRVNPDFKMVLESLPVILDRNSIRGFLHTEKELYKGFVACMLWGGINAKRCAKGHKGDLKTTDAYKAFTFYKDDWNDGKDRQGVVSKLNSVKEYLDKGMIREAFLSFTNGNHIPGIGVSFFTKLLYFLAPDTITPRPLIYDKWSTYIHCALLIDKPNTNALEYYRGVNKEGLLSRVRPEVDLYMDYLRIMKETAENNGIRDVSRLEAFLFGFALNGKGHKEEKRRRIRLKRYVLDYYQPNKEDFAKSPQKNTPKRTSTTVPDEVHEISANEKIPYRTKSDIIKAYKIVHQGITFYGYVGKDNQKVYCEVLSTSGNYPKENEIEAMGFIARGGNMKYYIRVYQKHEQDQALVLLEQTKNLFK